MDSAQQDTETITFTDDQTFAAQADILIRESEALRMRYMQKSKNMSSLAVMMGLIAMIIAGLGFGWFLLMLGELVKAVACVVIAMCVPLLLSTLSRGPIKAYRRAHKTEFMPKIAKLMGNLSFDPDRAISRDILGKTGVLPPYDVYESEDCFFGRHKGVRMMLAEARLKKYGAPRDAFRGVFVLMETPHKVFEGHTIITADHEAVNKYEHTRWKSLRRVPVRSENPLWNRFVTLSDRPDDAALFVGEKLFKELAEIADVFGKAPLTAVLFRGAYVFLMIPSKADMFEPSDMLIALPSRNQALATKREIARLVEIIDVLDIFQNRAVAPKK